jgi:hypothetical protein
MWCDGVMRGVVTTRIGPVLFGCLCCACCCACSRLPCATAPVLSFIHLERFEVCLIWRDLSLCSSRPAYLTSRLPLTSWILLFSFIHCVLLLPFALFYLQQAQTSPCAGLFLARMLQTELLAQRGLALPHRYRHAPDADAQNLLLRQSGRLSKGVALSLPLTPRTYCFGNQAGTVQEPSLHLTLTPRTYCFGNQVGSAKASHSS